MAAIIRLFDADNTEIANLHKQDYGNPFMFGVELAKVLEDFKTCDKYQNINNRIYRMVTNVVSHFANSDLLIIPPNSSCNDIEYLYEVKLVKNEIEFAVFLIPEDQHEDMVEFFIGAPEVFLKKIGKLIP